MTLLKALSIQTCARSSVLLYAWPTLSLAADTTVDAGLLRMLAGLIVVVLFMAALAWLAKRFLPGQGMRSAGVIRQVAAMHLSPRERVVVLAVADRWLVVGLHGGQMTALADLPAQDAQTSAPWAEAVSAATSNNLTQSTTTDGRFAARLQQAMQQQWQQRFKSPNSPT